MGKYESKKKTQGSLNSTSKQSPIKHTDIENLFAYLRQEVDSVDGLIQKTKALSNVLLNNEIFNYLILHSINRMTPGGINLGSNTIKGFNFTGIHTHSEKEDHYSIYARYDDSEKPRKQPGVIKGFLLRKEKTKKFLKSMLEARLILANGKECTLKYDYTKAC